MTLRNRLPAVAPDLAGWQDMMWIVTRRIQVDPVTGAKQMHFFNNNLVRPSSHAGLHAQLVEYDASRDDGVLVGQNPPGQQIVAPGESRSYRWYAGDLAFNPAGFQGNTKLIELVATPVEFGASNLLSADRVSPERPERVKRGIRKALSGINLGLSVWSRSNLQKAIEGLQQHYLVSYFQLGFGQLVELRRQAEDLAGSSGVEPGSYLEAALEGFLRRFPLLTEQREGRIRRRFVESEEDLQWAYQLLEQIRGLLEQDVP